MIAEKHIVPLKEVCIDFIVPQRDKPTAFDGNIPWCRIEDIEGRYLNGSKTGQNVTKELADKMNMHLCPKGTVISACSASIGNQAITTTDCYTNQTFIGLVVNPKLLDNVYLYYFLESQTKNLLKLGQGATIKYISKDKYKRMLIPLPSITEQQSIVDYLDSAFAKIDAMKANAAKALNEAKALFQASLKEMLEPKEGWTEKRVGDVAEIKGGKRLPKGEKLLSEPTNHKYIRVADFNEYGTVDLGDIQYISDEVYEHIKRYIINKEDVYISIAGTIGKSGIIPEELDGANLTENACRLILSNDIYQKFMYYITISPDFVHQEIESTKVSAQPKLALTRLAGIMISYPSIIDQQRIADTLDSLKSKVDRLQENYDKISQECDALKQAILRQVFE